MQYDDFIDAFGDIGTISTQHILAREPYFALQQLHTWEKKGWLVHLMKGRRLYPKALQRQGIHAHIANSLCEPSYLSLERALRYYNLIPEGVYTYTSCTTKKTTTHNTPAGTYVYQSLHERYYWGYDIVSIGVYRSIRLANPEKTLCDYLYLHPELQTDDDFDERRINALVCSEIISIERLREYASHYPRTTQRRVETFISYVLRTNA